MRIYVKVINRDTGMPQVITKDLYNNIAANDASHSGKLEYMYDCDDEGNKLVEKVETSEPFKTHKNDIEEDHLKTKKNGKTDHTEEPDGEPIIGDPKGDGKKPKR